MFALTMQALTLWLILLFETIKLVDEDSKDIVYDCINVAFIFRIFQTWNVNREFWGGILQFSALPILTILPFKFRIKESSGDIF